jgi:hypothetical protein
MAVKIFKFVWFFSLLATGAIFFYVYASLPLEVSVWPGDQPVTISREGLFYSVLAISGLINVLVFIVATLFKEEKTDFTSWFYGLVAALNLFFVTVINFLGVSNSGERFDYGSLGILIYGSIGLIVLWSISWPIYSLSRKFLSKQAV